MMGVELKGKIRCRNKKSENDNVMIEIGLYSVFYGLMYQIYIYGFENIVFLFIDLSLVYQLVLERGKDVVIIVFIFVGKFY